MTIPLLSYCVWFEQQQGGKHRHYTARCFCTKPFSSRIHYSNRMESFNNFGHRGNQTDSELKLSNGMQSNAMLYETKLLCVPALRLTK